MKSSILEFSSIVNDSTLEALCDVYIIHLNGYFSHSFHHPLAKI